MTRTHSMPSVQAPDTRPGQLRLTPLGQCRGQYEGAVFVIASGPSASNFPLQDFRDYPMITMNGAISMFTQAGIAPRFYISTDESFSEQQPALFKAAVACAENVFIRRESYKGAALEGVGKLFLLEKAEPPSVAARLLKREKEVHHNFSLFSKRKNDVGFSRNLEKGIVDCRTVAYAAIQLAYYLGFNKVFLVGVDLDQKQPRFYETGSNKQNISPCRLDKHFETRILPSFKLMKRRVIDSNFKVYNLSQQSRIPGKVIPKVSTEHVKSMLLR